MKVCGVQSQPQLYFFFLHTVQIVQLNFKYTCNDPTVTTTIFYSLHTVQIVDLCLQYICYDPNYNYEDDDEEEDAMDTEGEEEG